LVMTEADIVAQVAFLLTWSLINFLWIAIIRSPAPAAALSLTMVGLLVLLSEFKRDHLVETVTFVDVMLIDPDTISYLLAAWPDIRWAAAVGAGIGVGARVLGWFLRWFCLRRRG